MQDLPEFQAVAHELTYLGLTNFRYEEGEQKARLRYLHPTRGECQLYAEGARVGLAYSLAWIIDWEQTLTQQSAYLSSDTVGTKSPAGEC